MTVVECPRSDLPPNMCWHCRGHEHLHVPDLDDGPDDGDWPAPERPTGWVHDECVPF